jgi:hypothetical protein
MDCSAANGVPVPASLRWAHAQWFQEGIRRMQCDQSWGFGHRELRFKCAKVTRP